MKVSQAFRGVLDLPGVFLDNKNKSRRLLVLFVKIYQSVRAILQPEVATSDGAALRAYRCVGRGAGAQPHLAQQLPIVPTSGLPEDDATNLFLGSACVKATLVSAFAP